MLKVVGVTGDVGAPSCRSCRGQVVSAVLMTGNDALILKFGLTVAYSPEAMALYPYIYCILYVFSWNICSHMLARKVTVDMKSTAVLGCILFFYVSCVRAH